MSFLGPALLISEVHGQFDLIGFDPRGIGLSKKLNCFKHIDEVLPLLSLPVFPRNREEVVARKKADLFVSDLCNLRGTDLIDNMSTADVAKDLNRMRRALGDRKLNYVGYSYGSYLGITYANLFPRRVGTMVLDGVIDPVAWATGEPGEGKRIPFTRRLGSDKATEETLKEFFKACDAGGPACSFSGDSESRFAALAESLKSQAISIFFPPLGGEIEVTYDVFIASVVDAMYNPNAWPLVAGYLSALESNAPSPEMGMSLAELQFAADDEAIDLPPLAPPVEFSAVACLDSDNPARYKSWEKNARLAEANYPYFGRFWTWVSSRCQSWLGSDDSRYAGPFDRRTRSPILLVNTLFDPATPYEGAQKADAILANSRLLTVSGTGHTSRFLSFCADQAITDYLLNDELPDEGAVCPQNQLPFGGSPLTQSARANTVIENNSATQAENRRQAMRIMGRLY